MNIIEKCGILTFHKANNYGAVLQAFALRKKIQEINVSLQTEIIDYDSRHIRQPLFLFPKVKFSKPFQSIIFILKYFWKILDYFRLSSIKKRKAFAQFRSTLMGLSQNKTNSRSEIKGYSVVIAGSDQVWNTNLTKNDSTFYLKPFPNSKKIAYAASFGHENISDIEKANILKYVTDIDYISLRESQAVKEVKTIIKREVEHVLDPTLLFDKNEWSRIIPKINFRIQDSYLLLYVLELNENLYRIAQIVSKQLNLKVIEIEHNTIRRKYQKNVDFVIKSSGPIDFINLFLGAQFVITNSFHGTAFSVNFEKDFYCIPHRTRSVRMESLLESLNLNDRLVNDPKLIIGKKNLSIDYYNVNKILGLEREKSISFLKRALEVE